MARTKSPPLPSTSPLPTAALHGFSIPTAYDLHRPSYIPSAVDHLLAVTGLTGKKGAHIIDLGAGTGKFTEILAGRDEGYLVRAVEPHPDMRRVLVGKRLKSVEVWEGSAEGGGLRREDGEVDVAIEWDGWADAVIVAQAFHWFATPSALKHIHTLLRPSGSLALIWNIEDYNQHPNYQCSTPWESRLRDLLWEIRDGEPRYRDGLWRKVFDDDIGGVVKGMFGVGGERVIAEKVFKTEVVVDKEGLWRRIGTLSYVKGLKEKEEKASTEERRVMSLQTFRKKFDEILDDDRPPIETGLVKNERGEFVLHYIVHVVWTNKF